MSTPMSPNAPAGPDDFREQLSAWHDGALPEEAARFVLKRVMHDVTLRAEVGRWQVIGDALRRQPQRPASVDLAKRVAVAVAEEGRRASPVAAASSNRVAGRGRLRWLATAAAVGMAAVLMWPSAEMPVSEGSAAPVAVVVPVGSTAPLARPNRLRPIPPRLAEPVGSASAVASVPPLVRAPQPTPEQLAPLPVVDAPTRPWPRSAAGEGTYAVDYRVPAAVPSRQ